MYLGTPNVSIILMSQFQSDVSPQDLECCSENQCRKLEVQDLSSILSSVLLPDF